MSSLDKLGIRGIRSFDSNSLNVIQFYSPLTVIVGHNGSGKTTIIESLKYITTGDLPPNTKGGAFIHDPSLAGDASVKAEVMLRFRNVGSEQMTASRRLQVTKKKATLTMKTLEGTLSYQGKGKEDSERRTLSTKCAELDIEIPRQLGVSKAILENVIFCHQEDSNWPLAEPAGLKKKFDDIFEATKYTKALDNIKAIRKEAATELKVDKERLESLKVDKTRAEKLSTSIDRLTAEIEAKQVDHDKLDAQITELSDTNKKFYEGAAKYSQIITEAEGLIKTRDMILENIESMKEGIDILEGTDAELRELREQSKRRLETHEERLSEKQHLLGDEEEELSKLRKRHAQKMGELGSYQGSQRRYEQSLTERNDLIVRLGGTHGIKGYEMSQLSQEKINSFTQALAELQKGQQQEIDEIRQATKAEEDAKLAEIAKLRAESAADERTKESLSQQISVMRRRVREVTDKIDDSRVSDADIHEADSALADNRTRLQNAKKALTEGRFDATIRARDEEQKAVEDARDALHGELTTLNRQADTRARLGIKRGDAKTKEDNIAKLIDRYGAKFEELVGGKMHRDTAERLLAQATTEKEAALAGAESVNAAASRELQQVEAKVSFASSQLTSFKTELQHLTARVRQVTEGAKLEDRLAETEEELELRKTEIATMDASVKVFERFLKQGRKDNACGACRRRFKGDELEAFERVCNDYIRNAPRRKRECEAEIADWTGELQDLKAVAPLELQAKKLQETDIPKIGVEYEEANSKLNNVANKANEALAEVTKLKDQVRDLQLLKRATAEMARYTQEIKDLNREIQGLEDQLSASGSTRTAEDVQTELDSHTAKLVEIKKSIDQLRNDREKKRALVQSLENQIHQGELALSEKRQQLKELQGWEKQKDEFRREIGELEAQVATFDTKLRSKSGPLRRLDEEIKQMRAESSEREGAAMLQLTSYNKGLDQIDQVNKEIGRYERSGNESNLRQCASAINELALSMKEVAERVQAIQKALAALDREQTEAKSHERNIADNIRLREYAARVKKVEAELEDIDVEQAEKARELYDERYQTSRRKQDALTGQQARLSGEIATDTKNLGDKHKEMVTEFKNITSRYTQQLVKVKTSEMASLDLEKYGKALDSAIMKYHSHKMMEINDTIQTLWQKTYQGTDIDKIMIKSENENVKSNRSYNYRVVMFKDQVEMDMRGRCSAGQKVLASIIIRLALAESFGTHCGVLALDEPTTNLDRDNIQALATSLAEIIKERSGQSNFQLIVITHDEDFLSELGRSDVLDKYWRVHRDQHQKSVISKERLA